MLADAKWSLTILTETSTTSERVNQMGQGSTYDEKT